MQAYRIYDSAQDTDSLRYFFRKTMAAAHAQAKDFPADVRPDVRIELVEVPTTALAVIDYLNGGQPTDVEIFKRWRLSITRGSLVELGEDGKPLQAEKGVL